jgi:hypothetical protein
VFAADQEPAPPLPHEKDEVSERLRYDEDAAEGADRSCGDDGRRFWCRWSSWCKCPGSGGSPSSRCCCFCCCEGGMGVSSPDSRRSSPLTEYVTGKVKYDEPATVSVEAAAADTSDGWRWSSCCGGEVSVSG